MNGNLLKTFDIGHGPGGPAYFDGYLWVPLPPEGRIARVDPSTDEVTYFPVADRPMAAASGGDVLFVSTAKGPPALKPLQADQVATFSLAEDWLDVSTRRRPFRSPTAYSSNTRPAQSS